MIDSGRNPYKCSTLPENEGKRDLSGSSSGRPGRPRTAWTERWLWWLYSTFSWSGSERVAGTPTEDAASVWRERHLVLYSLDAMSLPMMRSNTNNRWESQVRCWRKREEDHVNRRQFCSAVTLTWTQVDILFYKFTPVNSCYKSLGHMELSSSSHS